MLRIAVRGLGGGRCMSKWYKMVKNVVQGWKGRSLQCQKGVRFLVLTEDWLSWVVSRQEEMYNDWGARCVMCDSVAEEAVVIFLAVGYLSRVDTY